MGSPLFKFGWFTNFDNNINELAKLAMIETWDYRLSPTGQHPILRNYIQHTFSKIESESKVLFENDYCIFNTGLVTENQEAIFGYFQKNRKPGTTIPWYFIGWRKGSDRELMKFSKFPEVADYFHNPDDLI